MGFDIYNQILIDSSFQGSLIIWAYAVKDITHWGLFICIKLELSLNAIHTPINVLDKAGTRVTWVLHIAQLV